MSDTAKGEIETLVDGLASPFWQAFTAHVQHEWGAGGAQYTQAIAACANDTNDTQALRKLQQVIVAQKEIQRVMAWPGERLKQLRGQVAREMAGVESVSRRGPGL